MNRYSLEPLRPPLTPMRDAKITDFVEIKSGSYRLIFKVRGKKGVEETVVDSQSCKGPDIGSL